VNRSRQVQRALPGVVLVGIVLADLLIGRGQSLIGLLTMPPLLAATALGRRATVGYGLLALLAAIGVGVLDGQFSDTRVVAQSIRLLGITLALVLAVGACTLRVRRDAQLAMLGVQAAADRAALQTAEVLQLSLLGPPPDVSPLSSAVRYLPANRYAQIGGDWYDAFPLPDGTTMLVIGDVAGHDAPAAATMAQVRGMLRAIALSTEGSPATVLTALDAVLADLDLHTLVTVLVATVGAPNPDGTAQLCWSNAGHPPPVCVCADEGSRLLARTPERVLGVAAGARRTDHELLLRPGDTLFLYTDGLVERRGAPLDDGFAWLVGELEVLGDRPLDPLCDELLGALGGRVDDDVALLAVRLPAGQPGLR
jgi:phosphoserine phosphatase RsbU/P